MADSEHQAIVKLVERMRESFPAMRSEGHSDDEIVQKIIKDAEDSGLYLSGEGSVWHSPDEFQAVIMAEASRRGLLLMSLEDMIALVKRYVDMADGDIVMGLLFSVASRLRGFLPGELCCYLHFRGRSGTGKSHAGRFFTDISRGDWHEAISEGALLNGTQSGRVMGLDEVDNDIRRIESAEGILRTGHTWGAKYTLRIKGADGNFESVSASVGGPKILTSIGELEGALESRCYVIEMSESRRKQELSVAWLYRHDDTERLATALDGWAHRLKGCHAPEDIEAFHHSDEYLPRLKKLEAVGARRTDLAHIFVTVDWLLGWNTPGVVDALATDSEDDESAWLKTTLLEVVSEAVAQGIGADETGITATKLLEMVNAKRISASLRPYKAKGLGKAMTELGFSERGFKVRTGNGWIYRFPEPAMKMLQASTRTRPVQSTLSTGASLDEKMALVREMVGQNRPLDEIEDAVGTVAFEHCREKGIVPVVQVDLHNREGEGGERT